MDDFEKEHPNIGSLTTVPSAGIVLKTLDFIRDVPDIMNIYPQIWIFRSKQKLGYFGRYDREILLIKNDYAEKYTINNKVYSVTNGQPYGIYYDKTKV